MPAFFQSLLVCAFLAFVSGIDSDLQQHSIVYGLSSLVTDFENGTDCMKNLRSFVKSVEEKHGWALKVLDASGQPDSGFILGNNKWIGLRSECIDIYNTRPLEINHDKIPHLAPAPTDFSPFDLQFAMAHLTHNSTLQQHTQMPLEYTILLGLCVPKSCSSNELADLVQNYFDERHLSTQNFYNLSLEVDKIRILREDFGWILFKPESLAFLTVVGVVFLLTVVGTACDVMENRQIQNMIHGLNTINKNSAKTISELGLVKEIEELSIEDKKPHMLVQIVKCFSVKSNVKVLVSNRVSSESVPSIHGLRLFGMLWVIMVHAMFYEADYLKNVPYAYRLSETFFNQILSNSTYCVDTYLFLSGFLVAYIFYKTKNGASNDGKPINYLSKLSQFLMMFINRFLRLTPAYLIIIGFANMVFAYYRETVPMYSNENLEETCSKYWWRNLLYINNLYPRSEMCLSWSWYLSLDTQCFAVSTFLLILSTIYFKTAVGAMVALILACIAATGYISYSIGYIPTMDEQLVRLDAIYDFPWNRIGPYLVGVITGYILVVKLQQKLVLKRSTLVFLWTVFPLLNLWILFALYTRNVGVAFSAVYMALSRTLWGIGLGWLLIACCTNNAGLIEKFLSFSGWVPLSRITYCCYLLNPVVASTLYLGSENAFSVTQMTFCISATSVAFGTFFYAFWASLFFEAPFIKLNKLLVRKLTKRKKDENNISSA